MNNAAAVMIGIEKYQDAALASAPHAAADAAAFAAALDALGLPADNRALLLDAQATRTAVLSRLRKLAKSPPEAELLILWWGGLAFSEDGDCFLACHDTQADDLAETSVALSAVLDTLKKAKRPRAVLFLDPRSGVPAGPFAPDEIEEAFSTLPGAAFLACSPGQSSHVSGSLKAGLWAHQVAEALRGKAPLAPEEGGTLTTASLQAHLEREVPRALRATFREGPDQQPLAFLPKKKFPLASVAAVIGKDQPVADPRLLPLKRGVLRGESRAKVKSLGGYRKFHRLPDRVGDSARRFVAELAAPDIQADVDQFYASIRELLGYKRRDVEGSADRGSGYVRTPDFEYSVSATLAEDDPQTVVWRREVSSIKKPEVVLSGPFQQVFGDQFDSLVFEFTRPFDIESWVDRIEEEVPAGVKLRCAPDCSSCDVVVAGFTGVVKLFRDHVEVQGGRAPTSKGLVEAFLQFQDRFSGKQGLEELPLLPPPKA